MKKIISIIVILAVAGGSFAYFNSKKNPLENYVMAKVERGKVIQEVSATGEIKPAEKIELAFQTSGRVEDVLVKAGSSISEGDILVSLDNGALKARAGESSANIEAARARYNQTVEGTRSEEINIAKVDLKNAQENLSKVEQINQASISAAKTQVESAKKSLDDTTAAANNNTNSAYEDALDTLHSSYDNTHAAINELDKLFREAGFDISFSAKSYETKTQALAKKDAAMAIFPTISSNINSVSINSPRENIDSVLETVKKDIEIVRDALVAASDGLDKSINSTDFTETEINAYKTTISTKRTNINTSIAGLTTAQQSISSTKLTGQTNINTAKAAYDSAINSLSTAEANAQKSKETAEAAIKSTEATLNLRQANPRKTEIDLARAQLQQAAAALEQIQKQIDETYLKAPINGVISKVNIEKGEIAAPNVIIIEMISTSSMEIEADIAEADIAKVKVGDKTEVTLDAFSSDEKWQAAVVEIEPAQTVISGVVYYRARFVFNENDERIKAGMTANLIIQTAEKDNVLNLPQRAVIKESGKSYVKFLSGEEEKKIEVTTGLSGSFGNIEIVSGVEEGQEVILYKKEK